MVSLKARRAFQISFNGESSFKQNTHHTLLQNRYVFLKTHEEHFVIAYLIQLNYY